jgi:hypothetical protein
MVRYAGVRLGKKEDQVIDRKLNFGRAVLILVPRPDGARTEIRRFDIATVAILVHCWRAFLAPILNQIHSAAEPRMVRRRRSGLCPDDFV